MADNKDIAVLAKKVYELSALALDELEDRKWEALLIVNAAISSAIADGVARMHADKEARWGAQIQEEGILSRLHPKWLLRTDDGKPPAIQHALASARDNPHRDLRTRLQALQFIAPADREPLTELARALATDAYAGARGDARDLFITRMRGLSKEWFKDPWLTLLPHDGNPPPVSILIENQGSTHDGGWHDDPTDDTELEKAQFLWADAIRTWDVDFLRDNPLSQLYLSVETAAMTAAETASEVASSANEAAKGVATIVKWAPYVAAGIPVLGLTTAALAAARQ
ncbi:hypothetical protein SAMN02745121_04760 [Nannocystis exedens]|uniref:Uncharacterized protein n=1 Tax=Nannocystis exedens TaxID=54 RepID=A0A1I2BLZ0_9BACT|nr:hypothetical protein [Nannocystis exedens]SFE57176.1 hypothetical protein SAMN02745121_04760 [Nannocystis exedens]